MEKIISIFLGLLFVDIIFKSYSKNIIVNVRSYE